MRDTILTIQALKRWLPLGALVLGAFVLTACGGGGGSSSSPAPTTTSQTGELVIGITDAQGDFVSYQVDVTGIALTRRDGTIVETLPLTTRIDFAELTDLTELVTVATVPVGVYESARLTLDFSAAEILVQDAAGNAIPAEAVDDAGAPLAELTVNLKLAGGAEIRILPGVPAAFSLDFDLAASNDIDFGGGTPVVTVAPFLLAMPELEENRQHRLRGVLASADPAAGTITVKIRPFRHRLGAFGELTVAVDNAAAFEVDGEPLDAAAGLDAVAALPENTPLVALGTVSGGRFVAAAVLAGTSVPWTHGDVVRGVVTARAGDTLTVRGAVMEYSDGLDIRLDEVQVTLGPDTSVTALGEPLGSLDAGSVSVGQRVVAFGALDDTPALPVLDASAGHVRMEQSLVAGRVVSASPLVLDVDLLNGRRPGIYDFSGTGQTAAEDADPTAYQVDTARLGLATITVDDPVRVLGLVSRFGAAPPDFLARTVIDPTEGFRAAALLAVWPTPTADPFLELSSRRLTLDLSMARAVLDVRGLPLLLANPGDSIDLVAPPTDRGFYALRVRGTDGIRLFSSFSEFSAALLQEVELGNRLRLAAARGRYNGALGLTAGSAAFDFVPATDTAQ